MSDVIKIIDWNGKPLKGINIRLVSPRGAPSNAALDDRFTDNSGNSGWPFKQPSSVGYRIYVNKENVDTKYETTFLDIEHFPDDDLPIVIRLKRTPLPELVMKNPFFMNKWIQGTVGFCDYLKFLQNDPIISEVYSQAEDLGSNARNVLFSLDHISKIHPEDWPEFYDRIPEFLDFANSYGQYIYAHIFADSDKAFSGKQARINHFNKMIEALLKRPNRFVSLANEGKSHANLVDNPSEFSKPDGMVFLYLCHTANGPKYNPNDPQGDLQCYHPIRRLNGSVKDQNVLDHPARQKDSDYHYPPSFNVKGVGIGEPQGFGRDPRDGTVLSFDAHLARMMGVGSSKGTAAFTFLHSPYGKLSIPFEDEMIPVVKAWFGND